MSIDAQTLIALSYLDAQSEAELDYQKRILRAREYHAGEHPTFLTDRLKEFLDVKDDMTFRLNLCRPVVMAVSERMLVTGFDAPGAEQGDPKTNPLAEWAWRLWQANRMDAKQSEVNENVTRDGSYFVLVDWDAKNGRSRFNPHQRYTDTAAGGDGFGVRVVYAEDDVNGEIEYAIKSWGEQSDKGMLIQRATVYYPDRVEKYARGGDFGDWSVFRDEGDEQWPLPWKDKAGKPLGVPVAHFYTPNMQPEAWEAIPPQDALNKVLIDLLGAADTAGFRIMVALGFFPTTDGKAVASDNGNLIKIRPGSWVGTTKSKTDADVTAIDPADLSQILSVLNQLAQYVAIVTDTPLARFQMTGQVASDKTQKQYDSPLIAKIIRRQALYGNAWEDALGIARRLQNAFGAEQIGDEFEFQTLWADAEIRNEKDKAETLAIKREKLKVPLEQIWREAGYSQQQIDTMKASDEYQAMLAMMNTGLLLGQGGAG